MTGADISEMARAGPVEIMARNVQKYWRAITEVLPLIAAVRLRARRRAERRVRRHHRGGRGAKLGLPGQVGILPAAAARRNGAAGRQQARRCC
jgi:hypothetical protein